MFIQGAHFDASAEIYYDEGSTPHALTIVNRVADGWMAVQLPPDLKHPTLLRVKTHRGISDALKLNAAAPLHLDATRLTAGADFRIFGRNLKIEPFIPVVKVGGRPAIVDLASSSDTMLVARLPPDVEPTNAATLSVDNGEGTGPIPLVATVRIDDMLGDSLGLKVPWGAYFEFSSRHMTAEAVCDGINDDAQSIQKAILQMAEQGGGVVQIPPGSCRLEGTLQMQSRVVLRGSGQHETTLVYHRNYPIYAQNCDGVGLENMNIENAGTVEEGISWRNNSRSFIRDVHLDMKKSRQWFLTHNTDFLFDNNEIRQSGSYDQQNPYRFDYSSGLIFSKNLSVNMSGSPTFQNLHDSAIIDNHFTRDTSTQDEQPVIAHHQLVIDFCFRITIKGNVFDVVHGPVLNTTRNDGETILLEGGGPLRTENVGIVRDATTSTIDSTGAITTDPFDKGQLPENYAIAIVTGTGRGQVRRIIKATESSIEVDHDWDVIPEAGAHYSTFVWGLKDVLIEGNTLKDNPRGIWLYSASLNNVAVLKNSIINGGGIYVRAFQKLDVNWFNFQSNLDICDNIVSNPAGHWMAHVIIANVRSEPTAFGTAQIGFAVRRNRISAHQPNIMSNTEEHASAEGFVALAHVEGTGKRSEVPEILGPIFQDNECLHCDRSYTVGSGVYGATFSGNVPDVSRPGSMFEVETFDRAPSVETVKR